MIHFLLFICLILLGFYLSVRITGAFLYVLLKITGNKKIAVYIYSIIFAPGVFIHEASHFLAALFLLVPVGNINLLPDINENRIRLGYVPIASTDPFRRLIIGIAPLVVGILTITLGTKFLIGVDGIGDSHKLLLIGFLNFQMINTMFVSKKDIEGVWILLVILFFLLLIFYFFPVGGFLNTRMLFSPSCIEIIKDTTVFLSIPLILDIILLIFFKTAKR